jgi:hypothetical protein
MSCTACAKNRENVTTLPAYQSWKDMKARCDNPNRKHYKDYGGRGITYPREWASFSIFHLQMGERPADKSLDRLDFDSNYSRANCEWADATQQAQNRRNNTRLQFMGQTIVLMRFADLLRIDRNRVSASLQKGQTPEQIAESLGFGGMTPEQIEAKRQAMDFEAAFGA